MTANALQILLSLRTLGKKSLGTPTRRRKDIIKIGLKDVGWGEGGGHGLAYPGSIQEQVDGHCQCSDKHSCSQHAEIVY